MLFIANAFSLAMLSDNRRVHNLTVSTVPIERVRELLKHAKYVSCVGHAATAKVMSQLTGAEILANRLDISLAPGDSIVVFQLLERLPEGKILSEDEVKAIKHKWFMVHVQPF